MLILADNDVRGAVQALRRILEGGEWVEISAVINVQFLEFEDLGLSPDAPDSVVWRSCQNAGIILVTGNRASGTDSLEHTIEENADTHSLPVITIGDPQRLIRDRRYAEQCALSLLDLVDRIDSLRGTGRLFIP
jgi:hypothetical protein